MKIVIARCERSFEFVSAGARDLGRTDKYREIVIGKAAMWKNNGRESDIPKAQAFAEKEGWTVLTYDKVRKPLEQARIDIVEMFQKGKVKVYA